MPTSHHRLGAFAAPQKSLSWYTHWSASILAAIAVSVVPTIALAGTVLVTVSSVDVTETDGNAYGFGPVETSDEATFALVCSGNVLNVSTADFIVRDNGFDPVGAGGPQISSVTGSGMSYTITVSRNGNAGLFRLDIAAGNDIAPVGGGIFNGTFPGAPSVLFAGGRPYLVEWQEIDPATGLPFVPPAFPDWGNFAYFRLIFSEPVQAFDAADFSFPFWSAGGDLPTVTLTGGSTTYDLTMDAGGRTGFANIAVAPTADVVSQTGSRPLLNDPFGLYGPQIELSGGPPSGRVSTIVSPRNSMPDEIILSFDEPVQNVSVEEVSMVVSIGGESDTSVSLTGTITSIGDQKNYILQGITYGSATPDGDYTVTLSPGNITDLEGAPLTASSSADFVLDTVGPTLFSVTTETAGPVGPSTVDYIFHWSEPLQEFSVFDVAETLTGTATATVQGGLDSFVPVPGEPNKTLVRVTVGGTGTVAIGAVPGGVTDLAGNLNGTEPNSAPLQVISTVPDLLTWNPDMPNPSPARSTALFRLSWSEAVVNFTANDIGITATDLTYTGVTLTPTAGGVADRDFDFTVSGIVAGNSGRLLFSIPAGAVTSAFGISNLAEGLSQNIDGVVPTGTITTIEASPTFDNILDWSVSFSERVQLPILSGAGSSEEITLDLTGGVTFGLVSQVHQNAQTPDERNYKFTAGGVAGDGTIRPRIAAGAISDLAGNVNAAAILGTSISHLSSTIQVGNVVVDVSNATQTIIGPGDYDIGAGARIGKLLCDAPIQVRGTTITGTGALSLVGSGAVAVYSGAFTVNGTTQLLTPSAPQSTVLTWSGVPIGVCSIGLNGGVSVNGWFNVADFAGNSFTGLQLDAHPTLFLPQLFGFRLGTANCDPTAFITIPAQFGTAGTEIVISQLTSLPAGATNHQFRLTATELRGSGSFLIGGHVMPYIDVTTTADGIEFESQYEPETGVFVRLDEIVYPRGGSFRYSNSGTITNAAGNLDVVFFTNFSGDSLLTFDNVVLRTTTPFGDIPLGGVFLNSSIAGQRLFFDASASSVTLAGIPFVCEGAPVFNATDGFAADTIRLIDLNAVRLAYDSLVANSTSVTLGGGGLSVLGLAFNASVTAPDEGEGLDVSGGFELPSNIGAASNISLAADINVSSGPRVNLNGLTFCTPAADALKIKNSNIALPQLCFEYTQTPPTISADVTVGIPEVIDLTAGGSVRSGRVDRISIGVDGLDAPLDATGAFIQSVQASVQNLSRTENDWTETYYVFNVGAPPTEVTQTLSGIPPIQFIGTVGATAGPDIGPFSLIEAEVTAKVDETQLRMDGTMTLVIVNVGGGYFHARWSGPSRGVAFGGYMTYLLVLRGEVNAALDYRGNFAGCAAVTIQIPEGLPFEGTQFGGISACVTAPPFVIRGCASILDAEVCVTISADGTVSLKSLQERALYTEAWDTPSDQPIELLTDDPNQSLYMSLFTGHRLDKKFYDRDAKKTQTAKGTTQVPVQVTAGPGRIVRLTYANDGANPAFTLIAPDGSTYTPDQTVDVINVETAPATFFTGSARREAGYILRTAQTGTYTVELRDEASLGAYSLEVLAPNTEPSFQFTDVTVGSTINFQWNDADPDSNATISIGLDTDRFNANGAQIIQGISEDDPANMASFDLIAEPIQPGYYWPYAMLDDGDGAPVISYADQPIFVPDVDGSAPIEDFQVSGVDGNASISFTPVVDPDIVSYKLSWTDEQGGWDLTNATAIPNGESNLLFGGFQTNQSYKFVLAAVSLVESSAAKRASHFKALTETASLLGDQPGASRSAQRSQATALLNTRAKLVPMDEATLRSLRSQAVELARSNGVWKSSTRDPKFAAFSATAELAAKSAKRSPGTVRRYVDSHFAVADNVTFRRAVGENNPPEFTSIPPAWIRRGDTYAHQLTAADPEGDAVTFALLAGPDGLTVSASGNVSWNTTGVPLGDVVARVTATDAAGATSVKEWTIGVVTIVAPAEFRFASAPNGNAGLGSLWSYQPVLEGASADASPTFEILGGPAGLTLDPATGALSLDTAGMTLPSQGLTSERIILKALEGGARNRTAIQEITLNIESRLDQLGELQVTVTGSYLLLR
jgi:hypothetical protein